MIYAHLFNALCCCYLLYYTMRIDIKSIGIKHNKYVVKFLAAVFIICAFIAVSLISHTITGFIYE